MRILLILTVILSVSCEREMEAQIQEAQKQDDSLCIEKFTSIIDQLERDFFQDIKETPQDCCDDKSKGDSIEARLKRA